MIDFDNDDGADVLVVMNEESNAVWIDGEKVYEYDDLYRSSLMSVLADETGGKIASYEEKEAVIALTKGDGGAYINWELPQSLDDIVFADQVTIISISSSADLPDLENFDQGENEYLIIQNRTDALEDDFLRKNVPESVEIFDIQNR